MNVKAQSPSHNFVHTRNAESDEELLARHEAKRQEILKAEEPFRRANARYEARLIATALSGVPRESRTEIGQDEYPANHIASSQAVQAAIDKIIKRRFPKNQWIAVHQALSLVDDSGPDGGYNIYQDAFRDAAFLAGMDYALSDPAIVATGTDPAIKAYLALPAEAQDRVGRAIKSASLAPSEKMRRAGESAAETRRQRQLRRRAFSSVSVSDAPSGAHDSFNSTTA